MEGLYTTSEQMGAKRVFGNLIILHIETCLRESRLLPRVRHPAVVHVEALFFEEASVSTDSTTTHTAHVVQIKGM